MKIINFRLKQNLPVSNELNMLNMFNLSEMLLFNSADEFP